MKTDLTRLAYAVAALIPRIEEWQMTGPGVAWECAWLDRSTAEQAAKIITAFGFPAEVHVTEWPCALTGCDCGGTSHGYPMIHVSRVAL